MAIPDLNIGNSAHTFANHSFNQWAADQYGFEIAIDPYMLASLKAPMCVSNDVCPHCAGFQDFVEESGEKPFPCLAAARQKAMRVSPLRHASTVFGYIAKQIPLDQHDFAIVVSQYPDSRETGHAATYNDRAIPMF
jgi:hypothetical protein